MESIPAVAQTLAQYGPWGFCAVLSFAVAYLFRLHIELEKEVRGTIQTNLKDTLSVVEQTKLVVESAKRVMEQTSEAVMEQKATTENLREIIRLLAARAADK